MSPDCLLGVVPQPTDSRLSETMCGCHGSSVWLPWQQCVVVMAAVCGCHGSSVWLSWQQCVVAMAAVCGCHGSSVWLPWQQCVVAMAAVCGCHGSSAEAAVGETQVRPVCHCGDISVSVQIKITFILN